MSLLFLVVTVLSEATVLLFLVLMPGTYRSLTVDKAS
jgi:hypothetical protein